MLVLFQKRLRTVQSVQFETYKFSPTVFVCVAGKIGLPIEQLYLDKIDTGLPIYPGWSAGDQSIDPPGTNRWEYWLNTLIGSGHYTVITLCNYYFNRLAEINRDIELYLLYCTLYNS